MDRATLCTRRLPATLTLTALLALGLSACSSLAPPYERPAAPVPERFAHAGAAASADPAAVPAERLDWQRFFGDTRLKRLLALALASNRDLRIAALNIEAARAQAELREADRWPTVSAGLAASRQPTGRGTINSLYTAGLQVTAYELDVFGRLRSASDVAAAQVLASEASRRAVQIALVAAVANAYIALAADDEVLRVTREALTTREASYRLIKLRVEHGASAEPDLRQAESLLEAARVALVQGTRQRALDENALELLVGQPLGAELSTVWPAGMPLTGVAGMPALPAGLPSEMLVRRPDVLAAEQQLVAAQGNIGVARAALFPRITLTGSVGSASNELSGLFKAGSWAWSFAPQLLATVFDAGRNQANLRLANVNRDLAVAQYERAIQSAFREVADALAGRATLGEQVAAQQRLVQAETARVRLADLRYRNGAASHLELLDAQRSQLAAEQGLVQAQAQGAQNLVTLYKVLGGGWSEASPNPAP